MITKQAPTPNPVSAACIKEPEQQRLVPPAQSGFQSESEIRPLLGKPSRRTMANWRKRGLPFVRLPGSRLIRYHWPSVQDYFLRQQKGQP
jgi:hypothetical protein